MVSRSTCRPLSVIRALSISVALMLSACTSDAPAKRVGTPLEQALKQSQQLVNVGLSDALEESEDQDSFRVFVRFNPGRCEAPEHEVLLRGSWRRAYLTPDTDLIEEAIASMREERFGLGHLAVTGRLSGSQRSERGVDWPVFLVLTLDAQRQSAPLQAAYTPINVAARCEDR